MYTGHTEGMPNQPKTKHRHVYMRADDELWNEFGAACEAQGLDRSSALRRYMEWVVRRPGVTLPKRPGVRGE